MRTYLAGELPQSASSCRSVTEQSLARQPVVADEFLPTVHQGDQRGFSATPMLAERDKDGVAGGALGDRFGEPFPPPREL